LADQLLGHGFLSLHEIDNTSPTVFKIELSLNGTWVGELQGACCLQPSTHVYTPVDPVLRNNLAGRVGRRLGVGDVDTDPDSLHEASPIAKDASSSDAAEGTCFRP